FSPMEVRLEYSFVSNESNKSFNGFSILFPVRNSLYPSAVTAKPLGMLMPIGFSWQYISPREAFLPPTFPMSVMLIWLKNRMCFEVAIFIGFKYMNGLKKRVV